MKEQGFNASLGYRYIADRPANEDNSIIAEGYLLMDAVVSFRFKDLEIGATMEMHWSGTRRDLHGEQAFLRSLPVNELHYTPGAPRAVRGFVSYRF